jgi:aminoglycoside N3'-acetyltransferase
LKHPLAPSTIIVAVRDQVSTPMNQETVLLHLKTGKYYSLNRAGTFVWDLLKTPTSVSQVVELMLTKFNVERSRCEEDVQKILQSLLDAGFVETRLS